VRPYLEKTHHKKRAGGVAQGVGPEFKLQYHKKKYVPQLFILIYLETAELKMTSIQPLGQELQC
jgi:hypothetical protein